MTFHKADYHTRLHDFLLGLDIQTEDRDLFALAFLHRSGLNERKDHFEEHNERLEFLGDAVLELVISDRLFHDFPDKPEGWLTDVRSSLVRGKHLGQIASTLGFSDFMLLSRGEEASGGAQNHSLLADAFEAFLGALYLTLGLDRTTQFIHQHVYTNLEQIVEQEDYVDPKSALQEVTQAKDGTTPEYRVLEELGLDHEKEFVVGVYI